MIDIAVLRNDPDLVRRSVSSRGSDVDVDNLIAVDADLRQKIAQADQLRAKQKNQPKGGDIDIDAARALKDELRKLTEEVRTLQDRRDDLWAHLPNLLAEDTPPGDDDESNVELRRVGDPVPADEDRSHEVIGGRLGIFDMKRGAAVAGSGFYYWRGDGARLAWALFSYTQDLLVQRGFTPMLTPLVAREHVFFGTGYLPFFAKETYKIEDSDLSLIGTSEQTLIGYYGDTIIDAGDLPILVSAFSPCFRTEAGAAGRASRGGYRVHQFHKVEQIVICDPTESEHWLDQCQRNAEDLLTSLELPYRVVRVCVGDLGAPAFKKYDTETWFPSFGAYRETHSNSNLTDYQARRFKIRFRGDGGMVFPHTISATGITDRAALAILENNVQPDGSVAVPEVLRPYLGGTDRIQAPSRS
ncbi:serine--tRNA ligase [Actinophytocola sp.]|uniref:serine--tRNA ligase n=1 Tax=Actinophytocola sp. TaxID=1872138 RepID=UPI0025BEA7F8|nr:serine--tRNA ligase [Actinophytocola sp.]